MSTVVSSRGIAKQRNATPRLSCVVCTERKVRCDKQTPCATCKATGADCRPVVRQRLPRGRHVKPKDDAKHDRLEQRLAELEGLLKSQNATTPSSTSTGQAHISTQSPPSNAFATAISIGPQKAHSQSQANSLATSPVAHAYWNDLTEQHPGLRNVLDSTSGGRSSTDGHPPTYGTTIKSDSSIVPGFRSARNPQNYLEAALAVRLPASAMKKICNLYLQRVDPIVKILHRPSLMDHFLHDRPYLHYNDSDPVVDLLKAAVLFITSATASEEQCRDVFTTPKTSLVAIHRMACEVFIDRVGLIDTEDVTVLQAFVLYLMALRVSDRSRTAWTLFATAVRLATAVGLNVDRPQESFFEQQMRRRLWYTISHLDSHLSFDRASEPLISAKLTHPAFPLLVNDADFGPETNEPPAEREGLSDMSLALFHYRIQALKSDVTKDSAKSGTSLLQKVEQLGVDLKNLLRHVDPNESSYAWSTYNSSLSILAGTQLLSKRPMHPTGSIELPRGQEEPGHVLRLAVTMLEHDIIKRTDTRGEPFRWFGMVLWHPLAVAIAECHATDNVPLLRHIWPTVETSFEYHSKLLSQSHAKVWRPLERLMLKTRARVKELFEQTQPMTTEAMQELMSSNAVGPKDVYQSDDVQMYRALSDDIPDPGLDFSTLPMHILAGDDAYGFADQSLVPALAESFWRPDSPSTFGLGKETWDDFINGFEFDIM